MMVTLFNYNTFNVYALADTKSIQVEFTRIDKDNAVNFEMLFELETLFTWLTSHIEINSVLFTTSAEFFSKGIDEEELSIMDNLKFQKFLLRAQKIIYSMFFLPQTIIFDLRKGAWGIAAELSIGADIRLLHSDGIISFNHLQNGISPSCGGIGFLSLVVSQNHARNWILSSDAIEMNSLLSSGYIYKSYDKVSPAKEILTQISKQAPIQRIQAKRNFLESILPALNLAKESDQNFSGAGLFTKDWKSKYEDRNFMQSKEFANFIQKTTSEEKLAEA